MWVLYVNGEIKKAKAEAKMCPNCFGTNEGWREVCRYCGKKLLDDDEEVLTVME